MSNNEVLSTGQSPPFPPRLIAIGREVRSHNVILRAVSADGSTVEPLNDLELARVRSALREAGLALFGDVGHETLNPLYHVCEENPAYKAWGIYFKSKRARLRSPFQLNQIKFDREEAIRVARRLAGCNVDYYVSVQGAPADHLLAAKYEI